MKKQPKKKTLEERIFEILDGKPHEFPADGRRIAIQLKSLFEKEKKRWLKEINEPKKKSK